MKFLSWAMLSQRQAKHKLPTPRTAAENRSQLESDSELRIKLLFCAALPLPLPLGLDIAAENADSPLLDNVCRDC